MNRKIVLLKKKLYQFVYLNVYKYTDFETFLQNTSQYSSLS
jgi:hypothetical protein